MEYWDEKPLWIDLIETSEQRETIADMRREHKRLLANPRYDTFAKALAASPDLLAQSCNFSNDEVTIGTAADIGSSDRARLLNSLKVFCPWKKGPFNIFGERIDSEWQSHLKWQRILPHLGSLEDKVVADIGCHNGYFMFKMLPHKPRTVIGIEPVAKHWFNFQLLNKFASRPELAFELFGIQHLHLFTSVFDVIFCMGILYHHTDPVSLLRKMRLSLRKKGRIIIDCQGIAGDEPVALVPRGRYAGAKGIWFLPTLSCLTNWVHRAGMQTEVIFSAPLSTEEQRSTPWAPIDSLKDFLTEDQTKTIEGYPAPHRFYLIAKI